MKWTKISLGPLGVDAVVFARVEVLDYEKLYHGSILGPLPKEGWTGRPRCGQ